MTAQAFYELVTGRTHGNTGLSHHQAWMWAARYSTPIWKQLDLGRPQELVSACEDLSLVPPIAVSVEYVDGSRFTPLSVPFAEASASLAELEEPNVIFVDARGAALAIITTEHAILFLRGTTADWPA